MLMAISCSGPHAALPLQQAGQPALSAYQRAVSGNLLYVSSGDVRVVYIYSYPYGSQVGEIKNLPSSPNGLCSDTGGHVWVTLFGAIYEYAHGGTTPIAKLSDGNLTTWACAVDPTSGDLAVVSPSAPSGDYGDVAIYKGGRGSPKRYKDPLFGGYYGCTYDSSGNLYVLGFGAYNGYVTEFAELPKGGRRLKTVFLSHSPQGQGDVHWDGQYVAVSSPKEQMILRFTIKGNLAREVGYTSLSQFSSVAQFTFPNLPARKGKMAARVIAPSGFESVLYWAYPQGGNPTHTLNISDGYLVGVTVSVAPKR
jgi:hypothetical protein